ncbi:DUF4350 domain-containing protein [Halobacteriales archaeon QS_3_64_16]|nr:MAG: DUF4350 domain-containing protein [Halobacteriales archaeon QS_3_64_16]
MFGLEYPQLLLVGFALCVAGALVVAVGTSSASFGVYNAGWDGASQLREEASAVGTDSEIVRNTTRYKTVPANGTIAVVLSPDQLYGPGSTADLRRFVENGGTLLVADERGAGVNGLLSGLGVSARLDGRSLRDERHNYRSPALVTARNVTNHPLTRDVEQLTLNYGTAIDIERSGGADSTRPTILVNTSSFAYLDTDSNGEIDDSERLGQYPVATTEPVGEGRVVVVSDPSIFINAMLDRPDNRAFLRTVVGAHDRLLIDYSHTARLPPLVLAILAMRESSALQLLFGAGALGIVGLWGYRPVWLRQPIVGLRDLFDRNGKSSAPETGIDGNEIAALLADRHPDWEDDRVRRVTRGIMMHRHDDGNNG